MPSYLTEIPEEEEEEEEVVLGRGNRAKKVLQNTYRPVICCLILDHSCGCLVYVISC